MNTIEEIEAEIREAEKHREYQGFTIADLRKTFEALQNPDDWRSPIDAWIPRQLYEIARVAVDYFTATSLDVVGGPQPISGKILVHSDGYRMGPAGDH